MNDKYNSLAQNERDFVDHLLIDIRLGIARSVQERKRLLREYDVSIYDLPRVMEAFNEQGAQLTDADLFPEDPMTKAIWGDEVESRSYTRRAMRRDYNSMDDESALIAMINDSITAGLLSPEELDELERKRKTDDFLFKVAIIAICVIIFLAVVVFGVR